MAEICTQNKMYQGHEISFYTGYRKEQFLS